MTNPVVPKSKGLQAITKKGQDIRAAGPVVPASPQEIVINNRPTGKYLTGGNLVGNSVPPSGYDIQSQLPREQLSNYEKLTGFERNVMGALAGIPKPVADMLEKFNDGWAGQALSFLDIPAEALERGAGFATQAAEAFGNDEKWKNFNDNLTAAWYAGSTAADYGNIPQVTLENGKFKFAYTDEMPGIDGVVRVRKAIAANVAMGMSYADALEEAKGRELENMGALVLRAQIQDMFVHIAGDPLNVVLPILKPIERLHLFRKGALATKSAQTFEIAVTVTNAEKKVSVLTESLQVATKLGDQNEIAKLTGQLAEAQEIFAGTKNTLKIAEVSQLSRGEQFALWLTGGVDELEKPTEAVLKNSVKGNFGDAWKGISASKFNPLALTPKAKALEFVHILAENVNTRLLPNHILADGTYDVVGFARSFDRAAAGVSAPEFGHLIATIEGQHVKGVMAQVAALIKKDAMTYVATGDFDRPLLSLMSLTLGESSKKILLRLDAGEGSAVYAQFMRKLSAGATSEVSSKALQTLLAKAGLAPEQFTPDVMKLSLDSFKGNDFYDSSMVVAEMMNKFADAAAKQGIARFGVTERGFFEKLSNMTKQAQTLAFMRLNPTYPVRNFVNNVVTLYARGAMGNMTPTQITDMFKKRGFSPFRLTEGTGFADDVSQTVNQTGVLSKSAETVSNLMNAASRGEAGWIDKLADAIRTAPEKIGIKNDFGTLSAKIEGWASQNAMATFYLRGENIFNDFGGAGRSGLLKTVGDFDPVLAKGLGDKIVGELHNFVKDANLNPNTLDDAIKTNKPLNITASKLRSIVETRLGKPVGAILTDEFMESITPDIMKAVDSGLPDEIPKVFDTIRQKLNSHIQGMSDEGVQVLATEVANRIEAEGPGAFSRIWGDAIDEWQGGTIRYDLDAAKMADQIRALGDSPAASSAWRRMDLQGENYWGRQFNRLEARMGGLAAGAEKAGLDIQASAVNQKFAGWRDGWKAFYDERRSLHTEYFDAKSNGKKPRFDYDSIREKLKVSYAKAVDNEVKFTSDVDKLVAKLLPDELKPIYLTWRERVANLRLADKAEVQQFRDYIRDLPYDDIAPAYEKHWKIRREGTKAIWNEENMGKAALTGNPKAQQEYMKGTQELQKIQTEATRLFDVKAAGQQLLPKEQKILDAYINKVADSSTVDFLDGLKKAIEEVKGDYKAIGESVSQGREFTNNSLNDLRKFFTPDGTAKTFAGIHPQNDPGKWLENMQNYLGTRINSIGKSETHAKTAFSQWEAMKSAKGDADKVIAQLQKDILDTEQAIIKGIEVPTETKLAESIEDVSAETPKLPDALARSNPRYGYRGQNFELAFDSDVDKALYIVANPKTASKREGDFMKFLNKVYPELSDAEIKATGRAVRDRIKQLAKDGKGDILSIPAGETPRVKKFISPDVKVPEVKPTPKGFIPDYDAIAKPEQYTGVGIDQLDYTKGQEALDILQQEAVKMSQEPRLRWSDLSIDQQKGIERYVANVKGQMGDARYASTRFAEYGRDSALLNYNRRYNYNTWLGTVMPYEFWGTQSMYKWALHSIDRPAMLTTYLRMKKFLETGYRPENGLPSRLRGTLRIPIPFMPEWMGGEGFIDPMRMALPFDGWAQPFEALQKQQQGDEGMALRKLEEMLNDGKISQDEYDQASTEKTGTTWERAIVNAQQDDTEERLNPWDFATMLTSPHAPITWAYNAMRGEETGAVLPITNTIGSVLSGFGLDPAGPLNPEAATRKALGLHPFNKWDDYYVERALSNMVAMGELSSVEARKAMIEKSGVAWEEAYRMTWMEKSLGPVGAGFKVLGLPIKGYPDGERDIKENWKTMKAEYEAAWDEYNLNSDYAGTVGKFNEKWPEFEPRLALFDKPEVRLSKFMEQSLWDKWNNLDKIEQFAVLEQMPDFKREFVNKTTRLENVPPERMAVWLKLLGGEKIGSLDAGDVAPLNMPDPAVAKVAQAFYDSRDRMFPSWDKVQDAYFDLPKGDQRKEFLRKNQTLKTYWGWRDDFLKRNSQIVPFVTDTAPKWYKPEMENNKGAELTWDEWRTNLGFVVSNLVLDYANGEDLPPLAKKQLAKVADEYGWQGSVEDFAQMIAESER